MTEVLVIPHNHFDPVWRRCFDRPAEKHGVVVQSYAKMEEQVINGWLQEAPKGLVFDEGQAAVWRKYLERNPGRLAELKELAAKGLLNIVLAGETVQDTVMSTAEGLVRNFLTALPLYRELAGDGHPGLKMAWLEDAFGNSPNYPQVLKGVGADVACMVLYRPCPDAVWVGLDGTRLPCMDRAYTSGGGTWVYHPPCPECSGRGCATCDQTGMKLSGFNLGAVQAALRKAAAAEGDWAAVVCGTEEGIPDAGLVQTLDALNREFEGRCRFRFATFAQVYERYRPVLEKANAELGDLPVPDLNPAMPGCMVTRIRIKQRVRAVSYNLLAAEAQVATTAWKAGKPQPQPAALTAAWRQTVFCQFHDAITGTHIDSAYAELMDMLDAAETQADAVLRLEKIPVKANRFADVTPLQLTRTVGRYKITFDKKGILAVETETGGNLFNTETSQCQYRRPLRAAELILEEDAGDAWETRISGGSSIYWNSNCIFLGDHHERVSVRGDAVQWHGRYTGGDPKVAKLEWTTTLTGGEDGLLRFVTEVDWDTGSRRLRVVCPLRAGDKTALWEVPFGFIERTFDQAKVDQARVRTDTQEYGALHWVCKEIDDRKGVALFNKGLPCYRYNSGCLDLSLLRSPESAGPGNMPLHYEFCDLDGQRDTGRHRFEYALLPYWNGMSKGDLTRLGYRYNRPVEPDIPFRINGDVVVTAWKLAENGEGWILRLQEAGGRGTTARLSFDRALQVANTDLLERPMEEAVRTTCFETSIHKHGIRTLLIRS
jgi:alpha-mannosidase